MTAEEIGNILLQRRNYLKLKQEDVAELTGISVKMLYLIESGKGNPSLKILEKLTEVLGMEVSMQTKKLD